MANPQAVCSQFVRQYYRVCYTVPEHAYKFYREESTISRPDPIGVMTSASTLQGINDMIMSLKYDEQSVQVKTADALRSNDGGFIILVTGIVTTRNGVKLNFAQSFLLATQEVGFFVLSDIFRYIRNVEPKKEISTPAAPVATNVSADAPVNQTQNIAAESQTQATPAVANAPAEAPASQTAPGVANAIAKAPVSQTQIKAPASQTQAAAVPAKAPEGEAQTKPVAANAPVVADASLVTEAPKKSFMAALMAPKPTPTVVATPKKDAVKQTSTQTGKQGIAANKGVPTPTTVASAAKTPAEEVSRSLFIHNLPLSMISSELEEELKKFGAIVPNGAQVRSTAYSCFGFVDFVEASSAQKALQASPILINGRRAFIHVKREAEPSRNNDGRGGSNNENRNIYNGNRRDGYYSNRNDNGSRRDGYNINRNYYGERRNGYNYNSGDRRDGYNNRRIDYGDRRDGYNSNRNNYGDRRDGYGDRRDGYGNRRDNYNDYNRGGGTFVPNGYRRADQVIRNGLLPLPKQDGATQATVAPPNKAGTTQPAPSSAGPTKPAPNSSGDTKATVPPPTKAGSEAQASVAPPNNAGAAQPPPNKASSASQTTSVAPPNKAGTTQPNSDKAGVKTAPASNKAAAKKGGSKKPSAK